MEVVEGRETDTRGVFPHALGITDELVRGCSELCVQAALDVMQGNCPESVINRDVLDHLGLREKLERYRNRY